MQWLKNKSWVNKYIFPVPKPPRYDSKSFPTLISIPPSKEYNYELAANYFKCDSSDKIVIYSHGNYEDLGENAYDIEHYSKTLQINFLVYDYSGYGINQGTPNESTFNADIRRVYDYVVNERHFEPKNIILFGRSLGNGPTMDLAAELVKKKIDIGGVILLSPFTSICDLIGEAFTSVGAMFMADRFCNLKMVKIYNRPLFIIHGQQDDLISPAQSQKLYEASISQMKYAHFPEEMTHNRINQETHIITPVAWFLSKIYDDRIPIGKFVHIPLPHSMAPPQQSSILKASRGVSAALMDTAFNITGKKKSDSTFSTSQITSLEGLLTYIYSRLRTFSTLLKGKYFAEKAAGNISDDFLYVYEQFLIYEPFINIYVEMTRLRVALPPGAALLAKSVHMMQSAPIGLLHAQLCIGGLVYSWDQRADAEGQEREFSHLIDAEQTVRIPVRIYHIKKRWAKLMLDWLQNSPEGADAENNQITQIANEFVDVYRDMIPDFAPLQVLVQTWNSTHHYHAATQNCQDFATHALEALKLPHFATPNLFYSDVLVTYIKRVHEDPAYFAPSYYGNCESDFTTLWCDPTTQAQGHDYALIAAKHFLRNGGYTSKELLSLHTLLIKTLVDKYKETHNNSHFIVFHIPKE